MLRMCETTKKQKSSEEVFTHMFSSEDQEHQQDVNRPADLPPITEDCRGHGGGNHQGGDRRMSETMEEEQSYEEMFAQRYSSEDEEYQRYVNRPADPPPIVEEWRGRGGGNYQARDRRYQDHQGGRGWGGNRPGRGEHYRHQQDKDQYGGYDRGSQSNSHQENYSHYHRPMSYDRY
ncbi:RNMT-activating mini protein [Hippocampus comes]|nr:PREDICTED: RNMT-activating mini protein [Hippocampus comes]